MKLNYKIENIEDSLKPWLVLINGLFADLRSWENCVTDLTENFRVLRYDCRGQGKSPKPEGPYLLEDHTDDLLKLLNELGIEKCFLLGISNGGRIAMNFSHLYPQRVIAQVIADSYAKLTNILKIQLNSWLKANQTGGGSHRFEVAAPWVWGRSFLENNEKLYNFYKNKANESDLKVIDSLISGAMQTDISLKDEKTPTLLLAGDEDLLTPIKTHKEILQNYHNGTFIEIKGGHASLLEYPENVKNVALPFMENYL